ncbi:MAG: branched-chain amino acid aminotransferase [Bacteroidia bacterium]
MSVKTVDIKIKKAEKSRIAEVDFKNLPFGKIFSDHMFVMDYADGEWKNFEIIPYGNLSVSPAMSAIHYGQSIFEGLKAYKNEAGETLVFRPLDNAARLNKSAERMAIPEVPQELFMEAMLTLLEIDKNWVPKELGASLYIRPYIFATDTYIGIKASDTYKFIIFTCPVGNYYSEPVRVKVEPFYTRAAQGGVGAAKAAGNYAASIYPARMGQKDGYHQLVWTDALEHKYIEESGTMNIFFVMDGKLLTPALNGTILAGITRDSVISIAKSWNIPVEERKVSIEEIEKGLKENRVTEAFGAGTAATIAHIQLMNVNGADYTLPAIEQREFSNKVLQFLTDLKTGKAEDTFGWIYKV